MRLFRLTICALACLSSLAAYSQQYHKVLIIDTLQAASPELNLIVHVPVDTSKLRDYKFIDSLESHARFIAGHIEKSYRFSGQNKQYPNVVIEINSDDQAADVSLPLDDSGGLLTFKGAFSVEYDTIRISKHIVYRNCFADTVKASMGWYRNYNSDTTRSLKLLKSKEYRPKAISKDCDEKTPSAGVCVINTTTYHYSIKVAGNVYDVEWSHGHKTMSRRQERTYEHRRQKGKPYTYFAYCKKRFKYTLSAEINLSD